MSKDTEKWLVLMRGLPGSGKSFLAEKMKQEENAIVLSNDDLLVIDGAYKWDEDRALQAHFINQQLAAEAMRANCPLLVLDNMNLLPYHCSPYLRLAKYYGYNYRLLQTETPWALDIAELEKRNKHNVPASVLEEVKKTLTDIPVAALGCILYYEGGMDPEVTLRMAQTFLEEGKLIQADEQILDYEDWRRIGGFAAPGGDEVAQSINEKLEDWRRSLRR